MRHQIRVRQSKPLEACLSWVAIESVIVAVVPQLYCDCTVGVD
jgi:hypothetical protein